MKEHRIEKIGKAITKVLMEKNKRYGDSALSPLNIFSKHIDKENNASNGVLIRLDDKLSRIKNSNTLKKMMCLI